MKIKAAAKKILLNIAKKRFHIETLETRNSDSLDFHDTAVWGMKEALEEAYKAGYEAGRNQNEKKPAPKYLLEHSAFDNKDYDYLSGKGYSNKEIEDIWNTDNKRAEFSKG
jgi:hypothetical protein